MVTILLICSMVVSTMAQSKHIPVDSKLINYGGSFHLVQQGDGMLLNRHSDELFTKKNIYIGKSKAITTSGIYIEFRSDSPSIKMHFSDQPNGSYRFKMFAVYRDGVAAGQLPPESGVLTNESGEAVTWRIYMPIFYSLEFKGLEIDEQSNMYKVKRSKLPVYVAIGDSISHGVGQALVSSDKTYPAILASLKSWDLYNLAVGGSQITPAIADELLGEKVDHITLLWGYNDWNSGSASLEQIESRYKELLVRLREVQPKAKIYAILPTFTTTVKRRNGDTTTPISRVREIEQRVAESMQAAGDKRLFIIDGSSLTTEADLRDQVHLNNDGAQRLAEGLNGAIK